MSLFIGALLLFLVITVSSEPACQCILVRPDETTRWGGNHWIAYRQEDIYKSISGKVEVGFGALILDDALVEVFDHPDYLLCEWEEYNPNNCTTHPPKEQRRISACKTGKDGKFCFRNIPPGKYELRVSKDAGFNVNHLYVEVDPGNPESVSKAIVVDMSVGD